MTEHKYAIANVAAHDGGHLYQIATNGTDPQTASIELSKSIIKKGGDLIEIHPMQENLETVFSQISSGKSDFKETSNV